MSKKPGSQSLEQEISGLALKKLAKKTPQEFLDELKAQGIGNLEDLVKKTLEAARSAAQKGSIAFSDEIFGVCYKFTTYRPHFDAGPLEEIVNQIDQKLIR